MNRTKGEKKNSFLSIFYNQSLTTQGINGKHEAYPMDFYSHNTESQSFGHATEDYPANFYTINKKIVM